MGREGYGGEIMYSIILLTLLAAVLVFSPVARGAVRPWSATPVLLILYSMVFLWIFKSVNIRKGTDNAKNILLKQPLTLFILLFGITAIISFIFSVYKHDSAYSLLMIFAYIGLYFVICNEFNHTMRKRIILLAIFIGTVLSVCGLMQYFGILSHSWWIPKNFLSSTYVNHNHFAGYLELIMPAAIVLLIASFMNKPKSLYYKLSLAVSLVVMFFAFLLTQSRGAWASQGVALIVMIIIMTKNMSKAHRRVLIFGMALLSTAALFYFGNEVVSSRLSTITNIKAGDDPSGGRPLIWQGALGMLKEKPITGFGIGNFDKGFYRYRPEGFRARAIFAHNDYLQAASEMGVAAPVLIFFILSLIIWPGLRSGNNPYALGPAIGCLSLSLHGFVDFNFHIPANMVLFIVWSGIIIGESYAKRK